MSLKKFLQKNIKKETKLYSFLRGIYQYRFWKPRKINDFAVILNAYSSYKEGKVFFIQIGANDGLHSDPIHDFVKKYKWKGILVEPIPEVFENLKKNYRDCSDHLIFENIAISENENSDKIIYCVDNSDKSLPFWVSQLGSFNKSVVLKHTEYHPEIQDRIIAIPIRVESFENLTTRYNVSNINLILIDTEGHDYEILKHIDLAKYRPEVIIYEHKHLNEKDYKESTVMLKEKGYKLYLHLGDTIALRKDVFAKIKH
jgi:FkbM family methyltransferase